MHKTTSIFFISALLSFQVCNAEIIARSSNDEALDLLNQLRKDTSDLLTAAFKDYVGMSDKVDAAAQDAKANVEDAALILCVNDQATKAINLINSAGMNVTSSAFLWVFGEEKHYIFCGGIDEVCINSTIANLQAVISELLPNTINTAIAADGKTIDEQVSLIEACGGKVAKSQKLVVPRRAADNGKAALNRLRQVTIDNIHLAVLDYIAMCNVVDSTALLVRASGTGTDLDLCVDGLAIPPVDMIETYELTLIETFLKSIYDAETQLVICGASDVECINSIVTDIQSKIESTPGAINTEVQLDIQNLDVYIDDIKTCLNRN